MASEVFGVPLRVNASLGEEDFALVCGDSMATYVDGQITIYVRSEMPEADWVKLRRKWVPVPRLVNSTAPQKSPTP